MALNADQQLRMLVGDFVVKLAFILAERDEKDERIAELEAKVASLEAEKPNV